MTDSAYQKCINPDCGAEFDCGQALFKCPKCSELLDAQYNWDRIETPSKLSEFAKRWVNRGNPLDFSGVWRFRELLNFCADKYKVTIGEGQTILQQNNAVAKYVDMQPGRLYLQYEGLNPSGSFKDKCDDGRRKILRMRLHRQYFCLGRAVCTPLQLKMHRLYRLRPNRLRQAQPGNGLWGTNHPDTR